jgi:HEAT repeat protein
VAIVAGAPAQSPATWEGKTLPQWIGQLTAEDLGTRWYAIYALGQLGPEAADAVEPLQKVLAKRSEQEYVRGTAAWALGRIGPAAAPAVPLLTEVMHSKGHVSVRRNANEALGNLGAAAKPAVPELLKALADEDATTRVTAAVALWKIEHSPEAVDALLDMLRRGKAPAPYEAAIALGTLDAEPAKVARALVEAFHAPDPDVRRAAARSVGQIGRPALPDLKNALADSSEEVRRLAAEALGWMGPAAVPPLVAVLKNESPAARRAAARALGRLGPAAKAAEPDLVEAVNDPDEDVRAAAAAALRTVRAEGARGP